MQELFLLPVIGTGAETDPWRPKYTRIDFPALGGFVSCTALPGLSLCALSATQAGLDFVRAQRDVISVHTEFSADDALDVPTRNALSSVLELQLFPGHVLTADLTRREVAHRIRGLFGLAQRLRGLGLGELNERILARGMTLDTEWRDLPQALRGEIIETAASYNWPAADYDISTRSTLREALELLMLLRMQQGQLKLPRVSNSLPVTDSFDNAGSTVDLDGYSGGATGHTWADDWDDFEVVGGSAGYAQKKVQSNKVAWVDPSDTETDVLVEMTYVLGGTTSNHRASVFGRGDGGDTDNDVNGYHASTNAQDATLVLLERTAGAFNAIGNDSYTPGASTEYKMSLSMVSDAITAQLDDGVTAEVTATDDTHSGTNTFVGINVRNVASEVRLFHAEAAGGSTDSLLADDIESTTELTAPDIGQKHALLADDVESTSELTSPALGQTHALLADDIESTSELTSPVLGESNVLFADDIESLTELTSPSMGQIHVLNAADVSSVTELSSPNLAQVGVVDARSVAGELARRYQKRRPKVVVPVEDRPIAKAPIPEPRIQPRAPRKPIQASPPPIAPKAPDMAPLRAEARSQVRAQIRRAVRGFRH